MTKRNQRHHTCLLSENHSLILLLLKCIFKVCLISQLKSRRINSCLFSCLFCFLAFLNKNESSHREIEKVPSPDAIPSKLPCWNVAGCITRPNIHGDYTAFLPGLKISHIFVIFLKLESSTEAWDYFSNVDNFNQPNDRMGLNYVPVSEFCFEVVYEVGLGFPALQT